MMAWESSRKDDVQRLVRVVVEKRGLFVGDRSEVNLHRAGETDAKCFRLPGSRLDDLDDLNRISHFILKLRDRLPAVLPVCGSGFAKQAKVFLPRQNYLRGSRTYPFV